MTDRANQLRQLYGVEFPQDFYDFWDWHCQEDPEIIRTLGDVAGVGLTGAFDVLAGRFDDVELQYPAVLHWRYSADPAEFITILTGDCDGLHWGYWFDDPGRLPPVVAAWYARDAFELWTAGGTVFEAVHERIDRAVEGTQENLESDPDYADEYRSDLEKLAKLQKALPAGPPSTPRTPTHETPERMGVVLPPNSGEAGQLLLRGKKLWAAGKAKAFDVLEEAYTKLGREPLAAIVRAHRETPDLPRVDILDYKQGDYRSFKEALAEPEKVRTIEVGGAKLRKLPDLSTLTELEELVLWGNSLKDLPPTLAACQKLRVINLYKNQLRRVPKVLFKLPALIHVMLAENEIPPSKIDELRKALPKADVIA